MSSDRFMQVIQAMPYDDVQVVSEAGLMANHRATLAKALDRATTRPVFIKCIWAAGAMAGQQTQQLASSDRLKRVADRLERVRNQNLPTTAIYDVLHQENEYLFIVMEPVKIMQSCIAGTPNPALACRILERLGPSNVEPPWIHFDICPRNTGLDTAGEPCLIDLESVYFLDEDEFPISCTAAKWPRAPKGIFTEMVKLIRGADGDLVRTSTAKHAYEVLLLATEVCLGRACTFAGKEQHADEWLLRWLADVQAADASLEPYVAVLRPRLVEGFSSSSSPDLTTIAHALRNLIAQASGSQDQMSVASLPEPFEATDEVGARMRADCLSPAELRQYDKTLVGQLAKEATPMKYRELVILRACYLNDPKAALAAARDGAHTYKDDSTLREWTLMLKAWEVS